MPDDKGRTDATADAFLPMREICVPIIRDILRERERQNELRDLGRFPFTAADASLTHVERLPILTEELGEIARRIQELPETGLHPVDHLGRFDQRRSETGSEIEQHGVRKPVNLIRGTVGGLRTELIQVAAIALAWVEAIDSPRGESLPNTPGSQAPPSPTQAA